MFIKSMLIVITSCIIPLTVIAKEVKFGTLNMQKVIVTVSEGKTARLELELAIKTKETELKQKKLELERLNKDLKDQSSLLSEKARLRKQKVFQEKFIALRNEEMAFQAEIKKKETDVTQKIANKVAMIVDKYSRNKNLDVVFESSSSGLLFIKNPTDLTDEVIKEYDQVAIKADKTISKR